MHAQQHPRVAPDKIGPDDPRYADLVRRGYNKRFAGKPDSVRLVGSTEQVAEAVQVAVRDNLPVAVRSGGHCLEGFVADPAVRVVIDTSLMTGVCHDPEMTAFAVEPGATLGEVYRKLFLGWGVTIPAGESPDIGVGGHVSGGAFGFLCRGPLAHAVLQGQLSPAPADQGTLGPPQRLPPRPVHPPLTYAPGRTSG